MMAKIPLTKDINSIMEDLTVPMEFRNYLGYSGLGHKCSRYLWYSFRWCYDRDIESRIDRIFRRGDIEEPRIVADLNRVGCHVTNVGDEVIGTTGHARGHIDGIAIGVPTAEKKKHLFECKTMKHSSFVKYMKIGLKLYSPSYWQQIHSYMGHWGLKDTLYAVTNKDTEQRDYQRIKFDKSQFEEGERKAFDIITSEFPPERMLVASKVYFECKFCDAYKQCWYNEPYKVTCRTCKHGDFEDGGKFSCSLHKIEDMSKEGQLAACPDYVLDQPE
jgi:hypothetical protein